MFRDPKTFISMNPDTRLQRESSCTRLSIIISEQPLIYDPYPMPSSSLYIL